MNKVIFGFIAVTLCFIFVESLTCNQCSVGLLGKCLMSTQTTCPSSQSNCYSAQAGLTGFPGFNSQGCSDGTNCNSTTNGTVLFASYSISKTCCSSNNCNPVTLNGATSAQLSLSTAVGAAFAAFLWNSWSH